MPAYRWIVPHENRLVHWRRNSQTFPPEDALDIKYKLESTQEPDSYFFLSLKRLLSHFSESVNEDCLKSRMKGRDKAALIRCPPCASFLPCVTNTSQKPGKGRGTSATVLVKNKRRYPSGAQGTQEACSFTREKSLHLSFH